MIVESDGNGGWFLQGVDHLNASVHITPEWCDEMERHQPGSPGFNRLRYLIDRDAGNAADIAAAYGDMQTTRRAARSVRRDTTALREWAKGKRANR